MTSGSAERPRLQNRSASQACCTGCAANGSRRRRDVGIASESGNRPVRLDAIDDRAFGNTAPPAIWYRFSILRTSAYPQAHPAGFRGFVQADADAGCGGLYRSGDIEVGCWAFYRLKVLDLPERVAEVDHRHSRMHRFLMEHELDIRGSARGSRCPMSYARYWIQHGAACRQSSTSVAIAYATNR